jgi:hypothetical protein
MNKQQDRYNRFLRPPNGNTVTLFIFIIQYILLHRKNRAHHNPSNIIRSRTFDWDCLWISTETRCRMSSYTYDIDTTEEAYPSWIPNNLYDNNKQLIRSDYKNYNILVRSDHYDNKTSNVRFEI